MKKAATLALKSGRLFSTKRSMSTQLYYLPPFPTGQGQVTLLSDLAALPGWKSIDGYFNGGATVGLPGLEEVQSIVLPPDIPASGFICAEVSSTFDLAWKLFEHDLLACWGFVLAASQNAGRGQLRRYWHSRPGNLYVTFRLPEDLNTDAGALLTGYLLHKALGAMGVAVDIKWPNDLIQDGRKVGGILLEERGGAVMAGVGLNLGHAPEMPDLKAEGNRARPFPAGALRAGTSPLNARPPAVLNVWLELVKQITLSYEQDLRRLPPARRPALLESCLAFKGLEVAVSEPGFADSAPHPSEHSISGVINGLGPRGELRLLLSSGQERLLHSGTLERFHLK